MTPAPILPRELLALLGNPRLASAFEQQSFAVQETQAQAINTVEATTRLEQATVLTLSANATLENERVIRQGLGISLSDADGFLTIAINDEAARVQGGFPVYLQALGPTQLGLPLSGTLVTREGEEALALKTLVAPKITGLADHADDTAAAAGGVPVGGVYHTAGTLRIRLA